jgi:hypothetical protein
LASETGGKIKLEINIHFFNFKRNQAIRKSISKKTKFNIKTGCLEFEI